LGFTKKISSDEARRCPQCAEPVCLSGCPLGIDIPGFIRFLREGDAVSALERIKKDNPFPAICGRICPAPCEKTCIFYEEGAPIAIRALERYASDFGQTKAKPGLKNTFGSESKKVAIVGSGPFAMSAASVLLNHGLKVVMFEAANEPGGVLRYGIPEFRLPQEVLQSQFEELKSQGLEIHTNILIGRMKPLEELARNFDAVLLATGASLPDFASIEGENLGGVYYAEEFLMRLHMFSKEKIYNPAKSLLKGSKTVVVGSGYAALDSARMAIRLGQEVSLIFGGLEEELEVSNEDLKGAIEEGLKTFTPFEPLKIIGNEQGFTCGVECRRLEIIEEKGSLTLEVAKEAATTLEAQTVVLANSQKANPFLAKVTPQLRTSDQGTIWIDEESSLTSLEKVFAMGSAVTGPMTVVEALAQGKKAAQKIISHLNP
jgi:glutamate synthase (NADPH/NADH) small chain